MRILIDINHPAHVHLFKNLARELEKKGHTILFTTRKKEFAHILLSGYQLKYKCLGKHYKSPAGKLWGIVRYDFQLLLTAITFRPDIIVSMGSIYASHVAFILRKKNILLQDTEHAGLQHKLSFPFSQVILNPACFELRKTKKQLFYNGYHELAYLHPNRFTPDITKLREYGLGASEKIVLVRFVSWNASHDKGHQGISYDNKIKAIHEFSREARVLITSEGPLPHELEKYRIRISPAKIHDIMPFITLLFGESATMASECAALGVPSIFIDNEGRGYTREEEKYGLVFNFTESETDQQLAIQKGIELLKSDKKIWKERQQKMLSEKIDVTAFLVWFTENFPESILAMRNDPEFDKRFK